jgi:molybdopterin-guanine dinucleotide biosynthesis protein A
MMADDFDAADVTAAILAGGEGTRVDGRDKGLLPLAGKPLVAWVRERLEGQAGRIVICANRNAEAYARFGETVADVGPGFRGPLAGIAAALGHCDSAWLLTAPVDSPRPPRDLCRRLRAAAARAGASAAVLHDGRRREPLFALYRRGVAASSHDALRRNSPVWRWQDELGAVDVDFSDCAGDLTNLNSIDDFREWEAQHD